MTLAAHSRFLPRLVVVFALLFVPVLGPGTASANSALDQYVEQVPDPVGTPTPPKPVAPPPVKVVQIPTKRSSQVEVAPKQTPAEPASASTESSATEVPTEVEQSGERRGHKHHKKADHHKAKHKHQKANLRPAVHLDQADQPGQAEAWSKAAGVSGVNAPLAIFVLLIALGMAVAAIRRRNRGGSV